MESNHKPLVVVKLNLGKDKINLPILFNDEVYFENLILEFMQNHLPLKARTEQIKQVILVQIITAVDKVLEKKQLKAKKESKQDYT